MSTARYNRDYIESSILIAIPANITVPEYKRNKKRQKEISDLVLNHVHDGTAIFLCSIANSKYLQTENIKSKSDFRDCFKVELRVRTKKALLNKKQTEGEQLKAVYENYISCDFIYISDTTYLKGYLPPDERRIRFLSVKLK